MISLKKEYVDAGVTVTEAVHEETGANGELVVKKLGYDVLRIPHKMDAALKTKVKQELVRSKTMVKPPNIVPANEGKGFNLYYLK